MVRRFVFETPSSLQKWAERHGIIYHRTGVRNEGMHWHHDAAYAFRQDEIDRIQLATETLNALCLEAVDHVAARPELMDRFMIPASYRDYVTQSWRSRGASPRGWDLMGRFDLAYNAHDGAIEMLEYNADTPTLAIETAIMQRRWRLSNAPFTAQSNDLEAALTRRFRALRAAIGPASLLHFTAFAASAEDYRHSNYYVDLARNVDIDAHFVPIDRIGRHKTLGFVDDHNRPIRFLHKLYPWDWMATEPFGRFIPHDEITVIEPAWKIIANSKALLPLLWEMFPGHPNLLPAGITPDSVGPSYVVKPIAGREGANIRIVDRQQTKSKTRGSYGKQPVIYQTLATGGAIDDRYFTIGSWVVGDRYAGLIVRESHKPIITDASYAVPHYISD